VERAICEKGWKVCCLGMADGGSVTKAAGAGVAALLEPNASSDAMGVLAEVVCAGAGWVRMSVERISALKKKMRVG